MVRIAFVAAFALLLGGCNLLTSEKPLFTAADFGRPGLKPGLWYTPKDDCDVDPSAPIASWPECADGYVVRGGRVTNPRDPSSTEGLSFVLTGGDPRVMQVVMDGEKSGSGKLDGGIFYLGLEPLETDDSGEIVAFRTWMAQCGPLPPKDGSESQTLVTEDPFPGVVMTKEGCLTDDPDVVRDVVDRSSAIPDSWSDQPSRWIRAKP